MIGVKPGLRSPRARGVVSWVNTMVAPNWVVDEHGQTVRTIFRKWASDVQRKIGAELLRACAAFRIGGRTHHDTGTEQLGSGPFASNTQLTREHSLEIGRNASSPGIFRTTL